MGALGLGPIFRSHKSQTTNHKLQITKGPKSTNHKNPIFRSICKNAKINCSSFEFVKKVRDLTGKKKTLKMDSEAILGPKEKPRGVLESGDHVEFDFDLPRT